MGPVFDPRPLRHEIGTADSDIDLESGLVHEMPREETRLE